MQDRDRRRVDTRARAPTFRQVNGSARESDVWEAREANGGAMLLALLVLLWGLVSLVFVPMPPFTAAMVIQVIACVPALVYFIARRHRPSRRVALGFSVAAIAYTLTLVPWMAIVWCTVGRPWEAFTVPQLGSVCMAFAVPRRLWPGFILIVLFAGESIFAYGYARHLSLGALVPVTEPSASVAFAMVGAILFLSRSRRHALAQQHVRAQSEVQALRRVAPLFTRVRQDLGRQLAAIDGEIETLGKRRHDDTASQRMGRALGRLTDLTGLLDGLLAAPAGAPCLEAERQLLDRDAQLGVTMMAALGATLCAMAILLTRGQGVLPVHAYGAKGALDATVAIFLVATRRRPSLRRATWALVLLMATALPLVSYVELPLLRAHRPYTALLGHKVIMLGLGLTGASRYGLTLALILVTAADALALYFGLQLGRHKDVIVMAEPSVTLVFVLVALLSLRLREQRRVASVQLLRAETEAAALHRRAAMFLALRDRLNSPLQTLVISAAARPDSALPPHSRERIRRAVCQLVALSRTLAELDAVIPARARTAALDAEGTLRSAATRR
jgi:hypothetical protein